MIEIYRSIDSATIGHLQSLLEGEGIATYLRNDNLSTNAIPLAEFTPALCIVNQEDLERAVSIVRAYVDAASTLPPPAADLICPACGESNPGTFATCWNCQTPLLP